jgi:hypothetical protein
VQYNRFHWKYLPEKGFPGDTCNKLGSLGNTCNEIGYPGNTYNIMIPLEISSKNRFSWKYEQ